MSPGLVRIETRRSVAIWLAPVMVALAWFVFQQHYTGALGVAWSDRSMAIRDIAQPVWPLIAGATAWMAGRRRRRGMAELLTTTPYPAWWRELSAWAGTVAWGVLVYVFVASVILVATWTQATWGGPSLGLAVHRTLIPGSILLAGLLLATAGVLLIQRNVPRDSFGQPMALSEFPLTHITPACSHDPVSVCVHPAFKAQLHGLSRTINRIAAPLVDVPGAPERFIDDDIVSGTSGQILGDPSSGTQEAQLRRDGMYVFSTPPARTVVFDPADRPAQITFALVFMDSVKGPPTDAQEAMMIWLLRRAGFSPDLSAVNRMFFGVSYPGARDAASRFGALPAAQRRAWLRSHFSALRAGTLTLKDLP